MGERTYLRFISTDGEWRRTDPSRRPCPSMAHPVPRRSERQGAPLQPHRTFAGGTSHARKAFKPKCGVRAEMARQTATGRPPLSWGRLPSTVLSLGRNLPAGGIR